MTDDIITIKKKSDRDITGLVSWDWQRFRGKGDASLCVFTFYRTVTPFSGGVPGSFYVQHLIHLSNIKRRECPREAFMIYMSE